MSDHVATVGAGLSGAVIARRLAEAGMRVDVMDARDHVAGNCHTRRDPETGVMLHVYGPHIFHTDDAGVWSWVNRFADFRPYRHQVRTTLRGRVYAMPINLHTINQFFGTAFSPAEALQHVGALREAIAAPANFEEQALSLVGPQIYEAFLKGYTEKQWGRPAKTLPAAILNRLPLRFSYDDNYFFHRFQGLPAKGYTAMVAAMLNHPNITLHLSRPVAPSEISQWDHVFWTGPLDAFFGHRLGRLGYRTLDFEVMRGTGDRQGCAVMNYADPEVPHTRITEHKHFAPWEAHERTVLYREYPREAGPADIPYYPIRLAREKRMLARYQAAAARTPHVSFAGRLGTYRYLDMDVTIREALDLAEAYLAARRTGVPVKAVFDAAA